MKIVNFITGMAICSFILFASCSSSSKMSKTLTTLSQNNWQLFSLGSSKISVPDGGRIPTLSFDSQNMKVSGSSGCNTFTGSFTTEKDKLSFGNIASTRMSCPDMNIETSFLSSLAKSHNFTIYDGKLVLKDSTGTQLMSFDPLAK